MYYWFVLQLEKHSDTECLLTQQKRFRIEDRIKPSSILKLLLIVIFMTPRVILIVYFIYTGLKIIFSKNIWKLDLKFLIACSSYTEQSFTKLTPTSFQCIRDISFGCKVCRIIWLSSVETNLQASMQHNRILLYD